jgi:Cro/C1-type HTH DNA-binding domain
MLILNVSRVVRLRGYHKVFAFLYNNGFNRSIASKLVNNKAYEIKTDQIEQLCILLNCTPTDLFEWRPDANTVVSENHALKSIIRDNEPPPITNIIQNVPIEKLEKLSRELNEKVSHELHE